MTTFVMYAAAIISVAIVIFMLIKKMDIKITLFLMGIVLMFVGCALGNPLGGEDFASTGSVFLDPLKVIADQFKSTISSAGFIILILGGYSAYMSAINANSVTFITGRRNDTQVIPYRLFANLCEQRRNDNR